MSDNPEHPVHGPYEVFTQAIDEAFQPYVNAVGRVTHAWNHMLESFSLLFSIVLHADQTITFGAWYAVKSDRTQIDMLEGALLACAETPWPAWPKARADMLWLTERARSLADRRNDAVHAPCTMGIDGKAFLMIPDVLQGNPRALKLIGEEIVPFLAVLEGYADKLNRFSQGAYSALAFDSGPWPERPALPSLKQKSVRSNPQSPQHPQG